MTPQLCGALERGGKNWPLPLRFDDWIVFPIDLLHPDDHLHFPELAELSVLKLAVVTRYGRMYGDKYIRDSDRRDYVLSAYARCHGCGYRAVQDVIIVAGEPYEEMCPFPRVCVWCSSTWEQNGKRHWARRKLF